MDSQLAQLVPQIKEWAQRQPQLRSLWVYGSRLKGTAHPNSDLDVCVLIDRLETEVEQAQFQEQRKVWEAELSAICRLKTQVEPYATDQQKAIIAECSHLVYQRAS